VEIISSILFPACNVETCLVGQYKLLTRSLLDLQSRLFPKDLQNDRLTVVFLQINSIEGGPAITLKGYNTICACSSAGKLAVGIRSQHSSYNPKFRSSVFQQWHPRGA
jgi:hypothetical protein